MGRPSPFPGPKLRLLLALLLLLAPPVLIQARELGARRGGGGGGGSSRDRHVVAGLPLIRMLPEPSEDDDDAGVPPKLITRDALTPAVSRPGGLAPPAPKPGYGPHPLYEHEAPSSSQAGGDGLSSSSPGVSGRQEQAPPAPQGNPPPHYRRPGPAAYVPRVVRDALARFLDSVAA